VASGRAWGCRGPNSIARTSTPCQAASVRGQSNQVLSEVLRAGRVSTAGFSPLSTPDSILICYPKSTASSRSISKEDAAKRPVSYTHQLCQTETLINETSF
jgi:hypothetical protein